jgi:hypothetical protein
VSVVELPEQMVVVPAIEEGAVLFEFTLTVVFTQAVVLQVPTILTKYLVVVLGDTDTEVPVPIKEPVHEPEYQL